MYCLDPELARVQGMEYFNTHIELRVTVEHCLDEKWEERIV